VTVTHEESGHPRVVVLGRDEHFVAALTDLVVVQSILLGTENVAFRALQFCFCLSSFGELIDRSATECGPTKE